MSNFIGKTWKELARRIAARRRLSEFTCGECERSGQCALPPSDHCVIRLEQMSREERKLKRRVSALAPW